MNGFGLASWMARMPDIKEHMALTPGRLGVMILAVSVGSLIGLPLAGRVVHRIGATNTVRAGLLLTVPGMMLAALTVQERGPVWLVMLGLLFVGLGNGIWDVSQNLEGTVIERAVGKAIMPWFHAAFSGGTVAAALVAALLVLLKVPLPIHLGAAMLLTIIGGWWGSSTFLPAYSEQETSDAGVSAAGTAASATSAWLEPRTLMIGLLVLAAGFTEGSANDWMAVAFVEGHHHAKSLGVLSLAVFLIFMTAGRILGTNLLDKYGRVLVLRVLFSLALVGCALVVFGGRWISFLGTALWGLGASLGFPVGMSAAADDPSRAHARISVVSTIGYMSFLGGPPLLGFLGDHVGVLHSLLAVGAVGILAMLVIPAARPPKPEPASEHLQFPVTP